MKTYSEMLVLQTYIARLEYLKLDNKVGDETFGQHRTLNQRLYRSSEWKRVRDHVIHRDMGCDLAIDNRPIYGKIFVHHINPISIEDLLHGVSDLVFEEENLITVSLTTHNLIHYGVVPQMEFVKVERKKGDTTPWRINV